MKTIWTGVCVVIAAALLSGCAYKGVGSVKVWGADAAASAEGAATQPSTKPDLSGTFDQVLTKRYGDTYVFTGYRVPTDDETGQWSWFRNIRRDPLFISAELTVSVNTAGELDGPPQLVLRQGDRLLVDGALEGPVKVEPSGARMTVTGTDLRWVISSRSLGWREGPARRVWFELTTPNVVKERSGGGSSVVSR